MLDRYETILGETYRRQEELHYAEQHRMAKLSGLPVTYYRKLACDLLIQSGELLVRWGKELQVPIERSAQPSQPRINQLT